MSVAKSIGDRLGGEGVQETIRMDHYSVWVTHY